MCNNRQKKSSPQRMRLIAIAVPFVLLSQFGNTLALAPDEENFVQVLEILDVASQTYLYPTLGTTEAELDLPATAVLLLDVSEENYEQNSGSDEIESEPQETIEPQPETEPQFQAELEPQPEYELQPQPEPQPEHELASGDGADLVPLALVVPEIELVLQPQPKVENDGDGEPEYQPESINRPNIHITVPITWECDNYDPNTPGEYTFALLLPEGYIYNRKLPTALVSLQVSPQRDAATADPYKYPPADDHSLNIADYMTICDPQGLGEMGFHDVHSNVAVLTPFAGGGKVGAVWGKEKLDLFEPFYLETELYFGRPEVQANFGQLGDGMTFTLHNDGKGAEACGDPGPALGAYGTNYIENALAIEIDTYCNGVWSNSFLDPNPTGSRKGQVAIVKPAPSVAVAQHIFVNGLAEHIFANAFTDVFFDGWHRFAVEWQPDAEKYAEEQILGGVLSFEFMDMKRAEYFIPNAADWFGQDAVDINLPPEERGVYWGFTGASSNDKRGYHSVALVDFSAQIFTASVEDENGNTVGMGETVQPGDTLTYIYNVQRTNTPLWSLPGAALTFETTLPWQVNYLPGTATIQTHAAGTPSPITPDSNGNTLTFKTGEEISEDGEWVTVTFDVEVVRAAFEQTIQNQGLLYNQKILDSGGTQGDAYVAESNILYTKVSREADLWAGYHILPGTMPNGEYRVALDISSRQAIANTENLYVDIQPSPYTIVDFTNMELQSSTVGPENWITATGVVHQENADGSLRFEIADVDSNLVYRIILPVKILEDYAGTALHRGPTLGSAPDTGSQGVILLGESAIGADGFSPFEILVPVGYRAGSSASLHITKMDARTGATLRGVPFRLYYEQTGTKWYFAPNALGRWTTDASLAHELVTGTDGTFTVENLPYRTYYLEELQTPPGYISPSAPFMLEILDGNDPAASNPVTTIVEQNIENIPEVVPFLFQVIYGSTKAPLQDAEFLLYAPVCGDTTLNHTHDDYIGGQQGCWGAPVGAKSNENGMVDFGDISTGIYQLVQTETVEGYELPSGQWRLTLQPSGNTLVEGIGNPPAFKKGTWPNGNQGLIVPNYIQKVLPLAGIAVPLIQWGAVGLCITGLGAALLAYGRHQKRKRRMAVIHNRFRAMATKRLM